MDNKIKIILTKQLYDNTNLRTHWYRGRRGARRIRPAADTSCTAAGLPRLGRTLRHRPHMSRWLRDRKFPYCMPLWTGILWKVMKRIPEVSRWGRLNIFMFMKFNYSLKKIVHERDKCHFRMRRLCIYFHCAILLRWQLLMLRQHSYPNSTPTMTLYLTLTLSEPTNQIIEAKFFAVL